MMVIASVYIKNMEKKHVLPLEFKNAFQGHSDFNINTLFKNFFERLPFLSQSISATTFSSFR